jgi:hypothetical protein
MVKRGGLLEADWRVAKTMLVNAARMTHRSYGCRVYMKP